ncbi:Biotin--protein ligase [Trichostrongylus colubriformis]|uniref:Biotin--protein ligase n=1 Tax=Trichostrongylus colubriformis TaxID=6319 RepID=A0AAN8FAT8_TRICO
MDSRAGVQSEANSDSVEISPSVTIEEMDRQSNKCDGSNGDIPYVDDSDFGASPRAIMEDQSASPRPTMEMQSHMALVARRDSNHLVKSAHENGDGPKAAEETQSQVEKQPLMAEVESEPTEAQRNPLRRDRSPIVSTQPPKMVNGAAPRKKDRSSFPPPAGIPLRRHSVMVGHFSDDVQNSSLRYRSLSPMPVGANRIRHSVCESAFADRSFFARDSFRRSYTPTRKFHATSDRSLRAMSKPPSILVYTGGHDELYSRIRSSLSYLVSADRYTVFHLSPEAMKKQPWIEPTTACLIIADTNEMDDHSWSNMQLYFNQAGKIIFVCQNRLLASLTTCGSSKKQADMIRMAFGSRDSISMGKDFEHFLKKSLKTLSKHGQVNTTFHSKDFAGGMSYSVVLSKVKDMPLFLYMENSAHQASAVFSDATSEQLLAPGSRILGDSLRRVGVNIDECTPPSLTTGVMMGIEDVLIDNLMGVRYGEEVGLTPKLFLRKTEKVLEQGLPDAKETLLPIEVLSRSTDRADVGFDFPVYFSRLRTRNLGRIIVYVPIATTTMDISASFCDAIPTCDGAVIVAGRQTQGKGRGGNEFVSPVGAAMFTVSTYIPQSSSLAKTPSFVQHIFAVALVDAVRRLSGLDDFPLRIKWPNDFYFNRSHKVGGLLAAARFRDDGLLISIGAGINVSNSQPTICLNDMVPEGSSMRFSIEEVIAETLNRFEYWMNMHEMKGQKEVLKLYYEFWLHSREEVTIEHLAEKGIIRGLDQCGYLQVRSKSNPSQIFSVGDNGNTFDMMKGLIRHKIR